MKELNMNAVWIQNYMTESYQIKTWYEYDQCECKTVWQSYLTDHIKSKHEEDRYKCDQCEYKASDKDNLSKHKTWMS